MNVGKNMRLLTLAAAMLGASGASRTAFAQADALDQIKPGEWHRAEIKTIDLGDGKTMQVPADMSNDDISRAIWEMKTADLPSPSLAPDNTSTAAPRVWAYFFLPVLGLFLPLGAIKTLSWMRTGRSSSQPGQA
jgi:hypothetical protein